MSVSTSDDSSSWDSVTVYGNCWRTHGCGRSQARSCWLLEKRWLPKREWHKANTLPHWHLLLLPGLAIPLCRNRWKSCSGSTACTRRGVHRLRIEASWHPWFNGTARTVVSSHQPRWSRSYSCLSWKIDCWVKGCLSLHYRGGQILPTVCLQHWCLICMFR